jgi:hypothetical protein
MKWGRSFIEIPTWKTQLQFIVGGGRPLKVHSIEMRHGEQMFREPHRVTGCIIYIVNLIPFSDLSVIIMLAFMHMYMLMSA